MALLVAALAGCSNGGGSGYRYTGTTAHGTIIAADQRKAAGAVHGDLLDGSGQWKLAAQRGKVVVVNYWGTWCPPCVTESPAFATLSRTYLASGVNFVGMNVKDLSRSHTSAFVTDYKITYPIVWDPDARTAIELGRIPMAGLPATVLIDRAGRVAAVYTGALAPGDLTPALDRLVAEQ
jgi:peroxiredoxin